MYSQRAYEDASEQERALPGWQQQYFQLSRGEYCGEVSILQFSGLTVIRERVNVALEQYYSAPDESLIFFSQSPTSGGYRVNGNVYQGSSFGFDHSWSERLVVSQCMSDTLMVVLNIACLRLALPPMMGLLAGKLAAQAENLHAWLDTLLDFHRHDENAISRQAEDLFANMIKDRVTLLLEHGDLIPHDPGRLAESRDYRLMVDWLEAHPHEPVTVTDLAQALDMPPARLRKACQAFTSYKLDDNLVIRRLNQARRDLIAARDTPRKVSDIALDWGFFHWGRFAARYRAHFGETPSETIRGRR